MIAYSPCGLFRGDRRRRTTIKRKQVIKPSRLRRGDLIGVISPAGPVDESKLQPGLEIMKSSGYRVRLAPHVYDKRDYLAGQDEARLKDLHTMFQDPEIKAIFCARGGYGSLRLLDKIHYDLIRRNPKIFAGYSDDNKSRATHKECFESALEIMEPIWQERAHGMIEVLKLVPPLLIQIRGIANDAFGGPSSLTDCIDLVLAEIENILTEDIDAKESSNSQTVQRR